MPWSSSGASSRCDVMYISAVPAMTPTSTSRVTGPIVQGARQPPLVALLETPEHAVEEAGEAPAAAGIVRLEQPRAHHRRQRERDHAGDDHRRGEGEGEFLEQGAGEPGDEADRREHGRQGDGHGDDRIDDLAGAHERRLHRPLPLLDMAVDVLDHDDGVVDDEADGEHEREQRHQIDGVAEREQKPEHADQRQRNGDDRNDRRPQIAEEQEDHDDDDDRRLAQGLPHFPQRGADEVGGVIGDGAVEAHRQLALDLRKRLAHMGDDRERVRGRRGIDADEHGLEPVEHRRGIGALRPELDLGDVAQADQGVAAGQHHQPAEGVGVVERGLGVDIGLDEVALHLARRRGEIVVGKCGTDVERRHAERGHAVGVEPDAHGEDLAAENLGIGDTVDGLQLRLHHAGEVVADLR